MNYPLHLAILVLLWGYIYTSWSLMGRLGLVSFGPLADRWGRRGAFLAFHLGGLVASLVLFQLLSGMTAVTLFLPVFGFLTLGMHAGFAVYFPELFPTRLRGLGTSTAEMVTRALTGGLLIYFLPSLFARWGGPTVFIACAVAMVVLLAPIVFFGHETSGRNMEVLGTPTAPRMASAGRPMSRGRGQVRSNIVRHR